MSLRTLLFTASLAYVSLASPAPARASDFYARLLAGPAYFHNDNISPAYDSSGFGLASQLDLGARFGRSLALHASAVYDTSRWMGFDSDQLGGAGGYETTVMGLGLGASSTWNHFTLGALIGAQLTTHPGGNDAGEGPDAAGLGPLFSLSAGYTFPQAFHGAEFGLHALARYRVGKDDEDPSGYQLGLGLSIALAGDASSDEPAASEMPESEPARDASIGYASAQIGWWNAELELLTRSGVYVAAGAPWVLAVLGPFDSRIYIPFGARIGYQFDASREWKLRAAAHLVGWKEIDPVCEANCQPPGVTSWQLFEIGARHESPSGWVYGIDVPLLAIENILRADKRVDEPQMFERPLSIIFTQVYVGYSWAI